MSDRREPGRRQGRRGVVSYGDLLPVRLDLKRSETNDTDAEEPGIWGLRLRAVQKTLSPPPRQAQRAGASPRAIGSAYRRQLRTKVFQSSHRWVSARA